MAYNDLIDDDEAQVAMPTGRYAARSASPLMAAATPTAPMRGTPTANRRRVAIHRQPARGTGVEAGEGRDHEEPAGNRAETDRHEEHPDRKVKDKPEGGVDY